MFRHLSVAIVAVAVGCHHARTQAIPAVEIRADTALGASENTPSADTADFTDLSGRWVTGSDNEPAMREIRLQRNCRFTPASWLLDQRGDSVYAWQARERWARGVAEPPEPRPPTAEGRFRGRKLDLSDGTNHWVLTYDAHIGHLRGTLNGQPFWAMRQILDEPKERCIPVP